MILAAPTTPERIDAIQALLYSAFTVYLLALIVLAVLLDVARRRRTRSPYTPPADVQAWRERNWGGARDECRPVRRALRDA